ncbi:2-dehydro-3-deoxy-D-gluconate 5-dehydrogenase KduD (plasmid) [Pseudoalteromonas lipolytica]|jgi:2-deoxy-D-gluconate 3-dehydrogenase|uniref:2-dehydro-3-deoxy-D-gluconate 5-dehydrogenase KduD n=1 Tax=Pseudoalteromonas lipolytica TaxID=570156 RepID=A0AAD0S3T9_9GAMM|nr:MULTISPECIES: 2-dehydro-3-deoxy-D-gluconate 5-dehydrogenase KduD [Pseudoalteromonas]AXV67520.1 2-dehydro-3-deoxy-D-gluconate 5-dehydrogenase KduD [Pseudoalteromonas donghaensis]MCC9662018.1 2-dehydro-3-deoxy-D-gluconate 5-dehydrogenase KduD [Pseudoalteromonas sp. MB41]QLJ10058.1 2-dehydro-3-deoxy-D-gluconate 5-dehydrogenase KduD [Pseudoalteromonas sp. JSTW]
MTTQLFDLKGKTALVTGASRGLGKQIAMGLAAAGADVICSSSREHGCEETCSEIAKSASKTWDIAADLSDAKSVSALAEQALSVNDGIDILVNVGGTIFRSPAIDYPYDEWQKVIKVNLDASFLLAQAFAPKMIEKGQGKIINIASMLSYSGGMTVPAYTASKHAIAGVTKALANEWAQYNIQVNAIAPGYFRTDNTQALQDDPGRNSEIEKRIPAGRWGEAEDLIGTAIFLSSRASDYVNGHILAVDGGWLAR